MFASKDSCYVKNVKRGHSKSRGKKRRQKFAAIIWVKDGSLNYNSSSNDGEK